MSRVIAAQTPKRYDDLERSLDEPVLICRQCGFDVRRASGLGITPGHWARAPMAHAARRAELLIDCEEDRTLRAVLVGMLREGGPLGPRIMRLLSSWRAKK